MQPQPPTTRVAPRSSQLASAAALPDDAAIPKRVERAFTFAILLSALRCTVQYVVLPFVLPWIGLAGNVPPWLTLALGTLAMLALVRNVRYLWRLRHARRWSYLLMAVVVLGSLLLFAVVDLRALLG